MLATRPATSEDEPVSSVLFLVHPDRPHAKDLADVARSWWRARGYDVIDAADETRSHERACDFAVSFGGDGTMLRALEQAIPARIPVLGINLGRMGYLTQIEPAGMTAAFERMFAGDFGLEERMALKARILDLAGTPRPGASFYAVNEAIVERVSPGHTIRVAVGIGGEKFLTFIADGLLVCTPTGSTAYNLSARGPVVSPRLRALILTFVAPHLVFDRSLVLSPEEVISLTVTAGRPAALVVDGSRTWPLAEGDTVVCSAAEIPAVFVVLGQRDFHAVLRSRFSLADR
jgi:NAD+ kinase